MIGSALFVAASLVTMAADASPAPADATAIVASASSVQLGNDAWQACDGDERIRWCAVGGGFPQSFQLESDKPHSIGGIRIVWEQSGTCYAHKIETSTDGAKWTLAYGASGSLAKGMNEHARRTGRLTVPLFRRVYQRKPQKNVTARNRE